MLLQPLSHFAKCVLLSDFAIVRSSGLLPMLDTDCELSETIGVLDRILRDWCVAEGPHFCDHRTQVGLIRVTLLFGTASPANLDRLCKCLPAKGD